GLGDTDRKMNRVDQAIAEYHQEVALLAKAADIAKSDEARHDLAWAWTHVGDEEWAAGKRSDAMASYRTGLSLREPLGTAQGALPITQLELAESYGKIGRGLTATDPERKR